MKVGSIGYDYTHDENFVFDSPIGPGAPLMLLVKSPALFVIGGERIRVKAGSFVLIWGDTPCFYSGDGGIYRDDWMYIAWDESDRKRLVELGIPVDKPVYLRNVDDLSACISRIAREHFSDDPYHEEAEQHLFELLLITLSRRIGSQPMSKRSSQRNELLVNLRTRLYTEPRPGSGIEELARELGMSRSSLQHSYKAAFGTTIIEDMIAGRIEYAKMLLLGTDLTLEVIAEQCGYASVFGFMRQFKDRVGMTPTVFRKSTAKE